MTPHVIVSSAAEADIDQAYEWYEARAAGVGERFLDAVDLALVHIAEAPRRFPRVFEDASLSVRRALLDTFPYGMFFVWDEDLGQANIIACLHGRREPTRWHSRL